MTTISFPTRLNSNSEAVSAVDPTIAKAMKGDLDSFNELVLQYQDAVYRQAYWILGSEEAAEDATQEAFLRAYRNMAGFNGGPFRPWILRIVTNYCYDQIRRQKCRKTVSLENYDEYDQEIESTDWLVDPGESVEETLERMDERSRILQSIQRLAPEYRAAVVMVDLQGLDYSDAAAAMNVPIGTFKSRLSRARVQIQRSLRPELHNGVRAAKGALALAI
jgi:RNA polymerase sigma factor (sigma-70 family)